MRFVFLGWVYPTLPADSQGADRHTVLRFAPPSRCFHGAHFTWDTPMPYGIGSKPIWVPYEGTPIERFAHSAVYSTKHYPTAPEENLPRCQP